MSSKANEVQVGGTHYMKKKVQHWDYAARLPYLEAQISRYLDRWEDKNGHQDLRKSLHYMIKLFEVEGLDLLEEARALLGQTPVPTEDIHRTAEAPDFYSQKAPKWAESSIGVEIQKAVRGQGGTKIKEYECQALRRDHKWVPSENGVWACGACGARRTTSQDKL